jgi:hypothetical protein
LPSAISSGEKTRRLPCGLGIGLVRELACGFALGFARAALPARTRVRFAMGEVSGDGVGRWGWNGSAAARKLRRGHGSPTFKQI